MRPGMSRPLVAQMAHSLIEIQKISSVRAASMEQSANWNDVDSWATSLEYDLKELTGMTEGEFEALAEEGLFASQRR